MQGLAREVSNSSGLCVVLLVKLFVSSLTFSDAVPEELERDNRVCRCSDAQAFENLSIDGTCTHLINIMMYRVFRASESSGALIPVYTGAGRSGRID
jgi:hypothetical protein